MPTNHTLGHLLHVIAAAITIGLIVAVIRDLRRARR
ncbi:hypothetical protein EDD94_2802 [Streptomyces sp. PanSC9]|nr:hypothetical protein EDD94_2802 [Streptomyces sp. PanSC9]